MYLLSIIFGPTPVPWGLLFRDQDRAEHVFNMLTAKDTPHGPTDIEDEFGQRAVVNPASIHGIMLEDLEKSKLARIEQGLHQARIQVKANEMARTDPILRTAAMTQPQNTPILSPGFNGRFS